MPNENDKPWVVAPEKKDQHPIIINAKPTMSASDRVWMYAMFLSLTSLFAMIWLTVFDIVAIPAVAVVIFILLTMVIASTPHK